MLATSPKDQAQPAPTLPQPEGQPKPALEGKRKWDDIPDFDACRDVDSAE